MGLDGKTVLVLAALLSAGCGAQAPQERELVLSYDGLVPVASSGPTRIWIRDGFPLAGYHKVMLERADIRFQPSSPGAQAPSDADRRQLNAMIREEFNAALGRLQLERVDAPGPGVLLVRGAILDVVTRPRHQADDAGLDSIGQATFMVELVDAPSGSVLARAVDTRAAPVPSADEGAVTTDGNPTRALLARWATLLVDALNDLTTIDQHQGA